MRVTSRTGRSAAAAWSGTARAQPASVWISSTMSVCSASTRSQSLVASVARGSPARRDDHRIDGPALLDGGGQRRRGAAEPGRRAIERDRAAGDAPGLERGELTDGGHLRAVGDDGAALHRPAPRARRPAGIAEDRPEPGVAAAAARLVRPRPGRSAAGVAASSTLGQRGHVVGAQHLEEAGLRRSPPPPSRRRRCTSPLHQARVVADEVGAHRPELLGLRHRAEREPAGGRRAAGLHWPGLAAPPPARASASVTIRVTAMGDMALTVTPGGRLPAELPGERGHGPLGAAVGAGVGLAASPTRR